MSSYQYMQISVLNKKFTEIFLLKGWPRLLDLHYFDILLSCDSLIKSLDWDS